MIKKGLFMAHAAIYFLRDAKLATDIAFTQDFDLLYESNPDKYPDTHRNTPCVDYFEAGDLKEWYVEDADNPAKIHLRFPYWVHQEQFFLVDKDFIALALQMYDFCLPGKYSACSKENLTAALTRNLGLWGVVCAV